MFVSQLRQSEHTVFEKHILTLPQLYMLICLYHQANQPSMLNRRKFIRNTSAGIGGVMLAPNLFAAGSKWKGANDRLLMGHIGVGQRGTAELKNYLLPCEGSISVAMCDVWEDRRNSASALATEYYRKKGILPASPAKP